jgi:intein-encoded DNA endonuclease-like protein
VVTITEITGVKISDNQSVIIKLYPNPINNFLNIEVYNLQGSTILELYSETGKLIKAKNIYGRKNTLHEQIDCTNFPPGTYVVRLMNKDQVIDNKIVIKK